MINGGGGGGGGTCALHPRYHCGVPVFSRGNYLEIGLLGTGLEIIVWSSKRSIYLVL